MQLELSACQNRLIHLLTFDALPMPPQPLSLEMLNISFSLRLEFTISCPNLSDMEAMSHAVSRGL